MKTHITDIEIKDGYYPHEYITVTVIFYDDHQEPHKSAKVTVYVDKSIKNIDDIKTAAIIEAKAFLEQIHKASAMV